ncbi:MAG: TetR/AcrR family transcriptional regulator, partial [Actinoplanes sp.]
TTRSSALLAAGGAMVAEWADAYAPAIKPEVVAVAADSAIRLTISHVMQPLETPSASADAVAEVFVRMLTP